MLHDRKGREMPDKATMDLPMRRFHENVDMEKLTFFLSENDKYVSFLAALQDPAYVTYSFAAVARKCGITLHELQEIYGNGMRHLGLLKLSTELPAIMTDVAIDAKSRMVVCSRCDGFKVTLMKSGEERSCPVCKGEGEIRISGDKHARDLVFETMKLTGQSGPLVAINQNFGQTNDYDSKMESMLKLTQSVIIGKPETEE